MNWIELWAKTQVIGAIIGYAIIIIAILVYLIMFIKEKINDNNKNNR